MITFVKTRHVYESYRDFWALVALSGFDTCFVDEVDLTRYNQIYITTMVNHEWGSIVDRQDHLPRRAHAIFWNLERPTGWAKTLSGYYHKCWRLIHARWFDEIWVSDRRLAQEAELRFVVLGSHPGLGDPGAAKKYDFCHMSAVTNRRQSIYKMFDASTIGQNAWPPERDEILRASKFALNVHQDDHPFQEPLRFALFAAYGLPILSETIKDAFPWSEETMTWAEYPGLVSKMKQMLENPYGRWKATGANGHILMTRIYRFDKVVRSALREST